jgi:chaperonin GroES
MRQRETVRIGVILRQIITSAVSRAKERFSLNPLAAGSVLFGEPGGPEQEGNDMAFRPLHDRVVVKRLEGEEKTKGGIIIPDTAKEKPQEGKIIAVGPGGRDETGKLTPLDVKAGDRVLFGKWSGTEVKIGDEELLIMKESDILGIVD